jgi:DNA-binding NtrC family response regulator
MSDPLLSGDSPVFRGFLDALGLAAESQAAVLLWGESGSGKSAAARWIHAHSRCSSGPCVAVSLAALPESLIEAELFGHELGAFTDARRARPGRFRQAHGGTLVLEDIDLLPKPLQVKLLRVLQERVVEPLGAEAPIPVEVRVIATAGPGLAEMVRRRAFRDDLYWRLAVVALEVPPLRARSTDLPALVAALLPTAAARVGVPERAVSPAALQRLAQHGWPGNVRELENALERALVLAPDRAQDRRPAGDPDVPLEPADFAFLGETRAVDLDDIARAILSRGVTLAELEKVVLARALQEHRGNVSAAARQVGITRRALEYRIAAEQAEACAVEQGPDAAEAQV